MGLFSKKKPTKPSVAINVGKAVYGAVIPVAFGAPKRETRPSKQLKETR